MTDEDFMERVDHLMAANGGRLVVVELTREEYRSLLVSNGGRRTIMLNPETGMYECWGVPFRQKKEERGED